MTNKQEETVKYVVYLFCVGFVAAMPAFAAYMLFFHN